MKQVDFTLTTTTARLGRPFLPLEQFIWVESAKKK